MNSSAPHTIAGYPYLPQALQEAPKALDQAEHFHLLLKNGALHEVRGAVADRPELLAALLPIVGNPEAAMNVRLGASVIFEEHAGGPALRALLPRLGALAAHADPRVRADACFYLGLADDPAARDYLLPRLEDADAEVREIAADSLAALDAEG